MRRYVHVLDEQPLADGQPPRTQRAGSSARITFASGGPPRKQSVVSVSEYGTWRVVLGQPQYEGIGIVTPAGLVGTSAPAINMTRDTPPFATVSWGTDGAQFEAELDWRAGSSFVVSGDFVQVGVDATGVASLAAGTPGGVVFPAMIARASAAGTSPTRPPSRTVATGLIGAGGSALIQVPKFARTWTPFTTAATDTWTFTCWNAGDGTQQSLGVVSDNSTIKAATLGTQYMVPAGCVVIGISRTGGIGNVTCGIEFGLDLG